MEIFKNYFLLENVKKKLSLLWRYCCRVNNMQPHF